VLLIALTLVPNPQALIGPDAFDRPWSEPNQPLQQPISNIGDASEQLFMMYMEKSERDDNVMAERWQRDADGILIFVSLHDPRPCS
jgi:hypothetical protein